MGSQCSCEKAAPAGPSTSIVLGRSKEGQTGRVSVGKKVTVAPPEDGPEGPESPAAKGAGDARVERPEAPETPAALLAKVKLAIHEKGMSRKEAWKRLDVSNDARIDRLEFQRWLLDDIGFDFAEAIDRVFGLVDADQDGVVSPVEFKALFDEDSHMSSEATADSQTSEVPPPKLRRRGSTLSSEAAMASTTASSPSLSGRADEDARPRRASAPDLGLKKGQAAKFTRRQSLEHFRDFMKRRFSGAKEAFSSMDKDNDKQLDREELTRMLKELKYTGDPEAVFDGLDENNDGFVTRDEFKQQLKLAAKQATEPGAVAGA